MSDLRRTDHLERTTMSTTLGSLTDYEQASFLLPYDLANGHAYHELPCQLKQVVADLPSVWNAGSTTRPSELERALQVSFAALIGSQGLMSFDELLISPTASNSIDIIGAYMATMDAETALIEPTFDNLALLFRRRGAAVQALSEGTLTRALSELTLDAVINSMAKIQAIFIVNPNNPTGQTINEVKFRYLCEVCVRRNVILIIDNSFRLFNRAPFDDYAIMRSTGVSFIAFEDTGKCLPTQDLKLSMMISSANHAVRLRELYRELYLGPSPFAMVLFKELFERSRQEGLTNLLWDLVDLRRDRLRNALADTVLVPQTSDCWSPLPVEWIRISDPTKSDIDLCRELSQRGVGILPGRHFFWGSVLRAPVCEYVRVSLLKPARDFEGGLGILKEHLNAENNRLNFPKSKSLIRADP